MVLNVKTLVGAFNQDKALEGTFSVIVKLRVIFGNLRLKFEALLLTAQHQRHFLENFSKQRLLDDLVDI